MKHSIRSFKKIKINLKSFHVEKKFPTVLICVRYRHILPMYGFISISKKILLVPQKYEIIIVPLIVITKLDFSQLLLLKLSLLIFFSHLFSFLLSFISLTIVIALWTIAIALKSDIDTFSYAFTVRKAIQKRNHESMYKTDTKN